VNLILCQALFPSSGGPSKSIPFFRAALNADVISWVPRGTTPRDLIWEDSLVIESSGLPVLDKVLLPSFKSLNALSVDFSQVSLVSCHSPFRWHLQWLYEKSKKYKFPYWFVPHGGLDPYVLKKDWLMKRAYLQFGGRRAIENANCLVFSTKGERDKALSNFKSKRSEVIYWPLSSSDFLGVTDANTKASLKLSLGIQPESTLILYLGRLHPMKRPLETIKLISELPKRFQLLVVGNEDGVSLEQCRQLAHTLSISDRIHVIGPSYGEQKKKFLRMADCYISLSHRENFNFTAAEAMAAGLPLILSKGNDLSNDIFNLAGIYSISQKLTVNEALEQISIADSKTTEEIGFELVSWATQNFSFQKFRDTVIDLSNDLSRT
jgi:glycosyltransferase involved in cell wall biosynthesis